jgi:hypothetical protein
MKKALFILLTAALGLQGCATINEPVGQFQEQKNKLALAKMLIEDNRATAAKEILTEISTEASAKGITDEAIFRLALLYIEAGERKIATGKSGQLLDRLLKEFPKSPWRHHAATVKGLLDSYDVSLEEKGDLEQTIKSLRSSNLVLKSNNLSLSKENKELKMGIEKLKNLDIELETKNKKQ